MIGRFSVCVLHPQAQEIHSLYKVTVETYLQCLECTYIENGTSFLLSLPMHIRESHNSLVRVPSNLARVFSYIGILFKVLSTECYIALFDSCRREDEVCLKWKLSLCVFPILWSSRRTAYGSSSSFRSYGMEISATVKGVERRSHPNRSALYNWRNVPL